MNHKEEFLIAANDIEDKKELLTLALEIIDEQEDEITGITQHAQLMEIILMVLVSILVYHTLKPFIGEIF